jgi:hypothetical protein
MLLVGLFIGAAAGAECHQVELRAALTVCRPRM